MTRYMVVAAIAVLALVACGTTPLPAGAECTKTSDCDSSLSCLEFAQFSGSSCTVVGHVCSVTCTGPTDPACPALGSFMCFAGCGSQMACGMTAGP